MALSRTATLGLQVVGLLACATAVGLCAWSFPYPSPLLAPLLPPQKRWPTEQVRDWVLHGGVHPAFVEFFYRDPERSIPPGEVIVAPADGLVRQVLHDDGTRYFDIALSYWDVHVQRVPCDAVVTAVREQGDRYMDREAYDWVFLKDKDAPVQKVVELDSAWGPLKVRLISSLTARRIEVWVEPGQRVAKGDRLGRIHLGSTVILEVPEAVALLPAVGTRVVGGETVLAREAPR